MPADKRALLKQWLTSSKTNLQPLTFPQRELWETSPVRVADIANHICCLIELRGVITRQSCEAALSEWSNARRFCASRFFRAKVDRYK